ncbi:MAG: S8 family serine peptidase [bacterium]|nr:S8 family serine peptidase [bacterium]
MRFRTVWYAVVLVFLFGLDTLPAPVPLPDTPETVQGVATPQYRESQVLVKLHPRFVRAIQNALSPTLTRSALAEAMQPVLDSLPELAGARVERTIERIGWVVVRLPQAVSVPRAVQLLKAQPQVLYAEPNYLVRPLLPEPNDPKFRAYDDGKISGIPHLYPALWNMHLIQAYDGWQIHPNRYYTAANKPRNAIRIAVIDSGIDPYHPDFKNAGGTSTDSRYGGQIDWTLGCSIFGGVYDSDFTDELGHGTHVAGIAAAAVNNREGVVGVAYNAQIVPIKIIDATGTGEDADLVEALIYCADNGIPVINMSLGTTSYPQILADAVNYAYYKGCILIAAANESGNGGGNIGNIYPAAHSKVLAVSPTGILDDFPSSLYAGTGDYIGVSAPGGSLLWVLDDEGNLWPEAFAVYSTAPSYSVPLPDAFGEEFYMYGYQVGTSMACPHVAGLAALYADYKRYTVNTPGGNLAIWRAIQRGADNAQQRTDGGWVPSYGFGRINVRNALLDLNARNATVGCLSGQVYFNGTPVQGAQIEARAMVGTTRRVTTAQSFGLWRIPNLPAGFYRVRATAFGYNKEFEWVEVVAGADTPGVDFWLGPVNMQPDTTPPDTPQVWDDGEVQTSLTTLRARWWSRDLETGIFRYEVAIGTSPGGSDVMGWTNVGVRTEVTFSVSLAHGRTYYVAVRAMNGAGLTSNVGVSDGIRVHIPIDPPGQRPGGGGRRPITVR